MATKKPAKKAPAKAGAAKASVRKLTATKKAAKNATGGKAVGTTTTNSPATEEQKDRILREAYAEMIELKRESIEAGDGDALLDALLDVCLSDSAMPYWLSVKVASAVRRYTHMQVKTLDEAFKVKKRVQFAKLSKRRQHGWRIYYEVCALHSVNISITKELFQVIGDLHGINDWKIVQECYSRELKRLGDRRYSKTEGDPANLPEYLKPVYESISAKRIKKRVPTPT